MTQDYPSGWLFGRRYTIRQRAFELRNAKGETVGIIGKPVNRGADAPVQIRGEKPSSHYTGMSLFMHLTHYGDGGAVPSGAAFYIQGPDHQERFGAIVEAVKIGA